MIATRAHIQVDRKMGAGRMYEPSTIEYDNMYLLYNYSSDSRVLRTGSPPASSSYRYCCCRNGIIVEKQKGVGHIPVCTWHKCIVSVGVALLVHIGNHSTSLLP